MGFLVFVNFFTLRVNLSVAIIEMVNTTYVLEREAALANVSIKQFMSAPSKWPPLSHEYALFITEDNEDNNSTLGDRNDANQNVGISIW